MIAGDGDHSGRQTDPASERAALGLPEVIGGPDEEALYLAGQAVERAPELIQWIESDGRLSYVNEVHTTLLGYTRAELQGMHLWDIDRSLTPELFEEQWREIKARGPRLEEAVLTAKDGSEHPVEVASIHTSLPGRECGIAFVRDISDRKRAEEILARVQFSLDHIGDYPLWLDRDGRVLEVSGSTCRHLEYSREELLQLTIFDIDPNTWDAAAGRPAEDMARLWDDAKELQTLMIETKHRTKTGREFPVEVSVTFVSFGGRLHQCSFCRDISIRKGLAESLQVAQASLEQAPDLIHWSDESGRVVYANEATCRFLGYAKEEIESLYLWDLDLSLSPKQYRERLEAADELGTVFRHEAALTGKDGQSHNVEITGTWVDLEGKRLAVTFARDVTERKRLEESLLLTQLTVDRAPVMVHWVDAAGRLLYINQETANLLGYTREELQGRYLWDIVPDMTPEIYAERWSQNKAAQVFHREGHLLTKDGRRLSSEIAISHVELEGTALQVCFVRDVTERKRLEQSLRLAQYSIDRAGDMVYWLDRDGRFVYANEAACKATGYSLEQLKQLHVWDINPRLSADGWPEGWKIIKEGGARSTETVEVRSDGREYAVEVTSQHLEFEGEEYGVSINRDISERKQAEQALRDSEERYRQLFELESDAHLLIDDKDYAILEANEAAVELYGYSRGELLGMTILELSNEPELTRELNRLPTMEVPLRWHRKKDGSVFPIEGRSRKFDWKGRPVHVVAVRDISERKRTEESLLLIQHAVEQAGDMIYWLDPEGRVLHANQATCDLLGYSPNEITQFWIWQLVPGGTEERFRENWQAILDRGSTLGEDYWLGRDGCIHAVEISSNHFVYEGRRYGVSFAREIGERKQAEQALRDSEERYRQLFELESDALVLAADDSRDILEVNQATVSLYGYSRAELLTMKDTELFATAAEVALVTDRPVVDTALHYHRKKDGTVFSVEVRGRHFEWKGQPVHVAAIRDVTERKRAEDELEESRRMLRLVLDSVPLRIAWRDRDLRYMGCNIAIALDARLPDTGAIVGLRDDDLPFRNTSAESIRDDLEVISSGVPKLNYDETIRTSEGPLRVMRSSKVPLRDRADNIMGVLSIHEDVTERVRTLEALRDREEQLRQSQKMEAVGRLAGGIAHDFNNVLTTIIGYSDLMLASDEFDPVQVKEDLSEIKAAAERASNLTRQILAFSRRQSLQPQVLLLNTVIAQTERLLTRTIGADVELRTVLNPDLGLVEVDEHQFVQILLNLAVNARDAMPDGGVLTLETKNVELDEEFCRTNPDAHPGLYIVLKVADTGIGMDVETAAHVFEPFYTTKAPGLGTGLGLSTVYGVVTQSGGAIALQSEPGKGSVFSIYLPRFDHPAVKPLDGTLEPEAAAERPTIMVVDDDATFRALTVRILEKRGYRVLPVGDGDRAVELLRNRDTSIDLLLTDIVLPGSLQGGQIGQMAASLRPGLPVLYMSAYTRDTLVQANRIEERAEFLEKPFTSEYLVSRIREMLDQHPGGFRPAGA